MHNQDNLARPAAREHRRALLQECAHALGVIGRKACLALQLALKVELRFEIVVPGFLERALGQGAPDVLEETNIVPGSEGVWMRNRQGERFREIGDFFEEPLLAVGLAEDELECGFAYGDLLRRRRAAARRRTCR